MSGNLSHEPVEIVEQLLSDLSLGTLKSADDDWPIYRGYLPDTPDNTIIVRATESLLDGRIMSDGEMTEHYGLQFLVRSDGPSDGRTKIRAIARACDVTVRRTSVTVDSSTYIVEAINRIGGVIEVGPEIPKSRRRIFSLNVLLSLYMSS